jgi:hypothetical protein
MMLQILALWLTAVFTLPGIGSAPDATLNAASFSDSDLAGDLTLLQTDTTPPVTEAQLVGTPGDNGWFKSDVIVTLSAEDESGIADIYCAVDRDPTITSCQEPFNLSEEGAHWVFFYAEDAAGNIEAMQRVDVKIDKTPPIVNLHLNYAPPEYTRVNLLIPHWNASDATSDLCTTYGWIQTPGGTRISTEPIVNDQPFGLFWMIPQVHEFRALARDCAGWETEARAPFEVVATLKSMQDALISLPAQDGRGPLPDAVYEYLYNQLDTAQELKEAEDYDRLRALLEDTFIEPEVQYLNPRVASMFVMDAWYIIYNDTIVEPTPTPPQPEEMVVRPSVIVAPLDEPLASSPLTIIESDDAAVEKSGTWSVVFAPDASGSGYLYSSGRSRDTMQIDFTGGRINVVFTEHTGPSEFAVELDGERIGTVDTTATQGDYGAQAQVRGFPSGRHMLRIIALSGNVAIDAFLVEGRLIE